MSVIFLDTCILIDCLGKKGAEVERTLSHLCNAGHTLATSISVVGEMVQISLMKNLDHHHLLSVISRLQIRIFFPLNEFHSWYDEVENALAGEAIYGSSSTDRLHLAFALMSKADVFLTSAGETRALHRPRGASVWPKVIDMTRLRAAL